MTSSARPTSPALPAATKFSRYRSVRKAAAEAHIAAGPPPPLPQSLESQPFSSSIARGPSRYRRSRPDSTPLVQSTSVPAVPLQRPPINPFRTPPSSRESSSQNEKPPSPLSRRSRSIPLARDGRCDTVQTAENEDKPCGVTAPSERTATRVDDHNASDGHNHEAAQERASHDLQRQATECDQGRHRQKERDAHLMAKDRAGFLPWKKPQKSPPATATQDLRNIDPFNKGDAPVGIAPGGGGIVPGTDAPISAVNAGERRVKIRYEEALINLPIDPETTPIDLIRAASTSFKKPIQPEASTLLESFTQLGLERPLRNYEHVRDVMNSWDRDTQNGLILVPSAKDGKDEDLEADHAPREQPADSSAYIYYSQKPGSWNKRWATLRSDGQIHVAKKQDAKEKDLTKICHLSDFDIYTPTRSQLTKIKPPKKHCMAVKSQQRSSMFLSTANFVHFFATDDAHTAGQWYRVVQAWRSWYLISKVGVSPGMSASARPTSKPATSARPVARSRAGSSVRRPSIDADDVPLQTLTGAKSDGETRLPQKTSDVVHAQLLSKRAKKAPPVSFPGHLASDAPRTSAENPTAPGPTFAPTGLLGRTYSQRQQQQRERELEVKQTVPFTSGPTLVHGGVAAQEEAVDGGSRPHRNASIRATQEPTSGLKRSPSQRQPTKPLLDFSRPEYREPPQHARKGRGIVATRLPPGGLVNVATSPEQAIMIPLATTWRRPGTNGDGAGRADAQAHADPFADGPGGEDAFTGLLAKTGPSQGGRGGGRGVMTGHRGAKGPMLDLSEPSHYAPGSLLAQVQSPGSSRPMIDRSKHAELTVDVGEGV